MRFPQEQANKKGSVQSSVTVKNGLSAYELAVKNGYNGTVKDWLDSLNGKSAYQLAVSAGYKDTAGLSASEELMKRYYLNAKNTVQLNAVLLQAISDKLFDRGEMKAVAIDSVFTARGIYLDIVSEDAFYGDPRNILKAFYVYAQHRELKAMSTRLLRALWHSRYKIETRRSLFQF